jgi:hypothetical protein
MLVSKSSRGLRVETMMLRAAAWNHAWAVDAAKVVGVAGDEVVEHGDPRLKLDQPPHQVGADKAGAPRDQHTLA